MWPEAHCHVRDFPGILDDGRPVSADYVGLEPAYHMQIQCYFKPQDSTRHFLAGGNFSMRRIKVASTECG